MSVAAWLQRTIMHLTYEIPFHQLPPAAREDAILQAARLKACLALDHSFILRVDDPTGESWVSLPIPPPSSTSMSTSPPAAGGAEDSNDDDEVPQFEEEGWTL